MAKALSSSLEDYLETIFQLLKREKSAHVKDIAGRLAVTMPSVTGALRILAERDLVNYRPYGTVTLTQRGRAIAEGVSDRHRALAVFFEEVLGLQRAIAEENACRIEHVVDDIVLERLACYLESARESAANWESGSGCEPARRPRDCDQRGGKRRRS